MILIEKAYTINKEDVNSKVSKLYFFIRTIFIRTIRQKKGKKKELKIAFLLLIKNPNNSEIRSKRILGTLNYIKKE